MTKMSSSSVIPMRTTFVHLMDGTVVPKLARRQALGGIEMHKKAAVKKVVDLTISLRSSRYAICVLDLGEMSKAITEPILRVICAIQAFTGLLNHRKSSTLLPIGVIAEEQVVTPLQ